MHAIYVNYKGALPDTFEKGAEVIVEGRMDGIVNYRITAMERGNEVIFLRKIVKGGADHSYGVAVAKLAGLPNTVLNRARQILSELESQDAPVRQKEVAAQPEDQQISMMDLRSAQVCDALQKLSVETLTPIEAMNELYKLKQML